jgi:uncharacterized YccA/Bax inhibitor family protein
MLRTSNPALKPELFGTVWDQTSDRAAVAAEPQAMTWRGTVFKTIWLLVIAVAAAGVTWRMVGTNPTMAYGFAIGGAIGGFILVLVTFAKQSWAAFTAPFYAALEGLFLGAISSALNARFPGIVTQAVGLTFGVMLVMSMAYASGIIKPTQRFVAGVTAATGAVLLLYIVSFVMGFFGVHIGLIHSTGPVGIGISVVIVIIAALNLVLDFALIDEYARAKAPKHLEWFGAMALMITLVWLYLEVLRLLSKLRSD